MIKKISLILITVLLAVSPLAIRAGEKSIVSLSQQQDITNISESYELKYGPERIPARVFYGRSGISVVSDGELISHLDTAGTVYRLALLNDVNGDGYDDYFTAQYTLEGADNLLVLSGKDGNVLASYHLSRRAYSYSLGETYVNTDVLMMTAYDGRVYLINDYHLLCFDPLEGIVFDYENRDNIWDFIIKDENIWFVDQLGGIGVLSTGSGKQVAYRQLAGAEQITAPYDPATVYSVQLNLWDIYYNGRTVYVTSESGLIYEFSEAEDLAEQPDDHDLGVLEESRLQTILLENDFDFSTLSYAATGINDPAFRDFRIVDENANYLLITAFMLDENCLVAYSYGLPDPAVIIYNKSTHKSESIIYLPSGSTVGEALFDTVNGTDCLTVVDNSDGLRLTRYDYSGNRLAFKDLSASANGAVKLSHCGDGRDMLEIYGSQALVFDPADMKATALFEAIQTQVLHMDEGGCYIELSVNGEGRQLIKYDADLTGIIWTYDLNISDSNHGFEFVTCADYDGDGYTDVLTLVNRYDDNDIARGSHFLFVDGEDGSVMLDKMIKTGTYKDEKNKTRTSYLHLNRFQVLPDIDKDGKLELESQSMIIMSGKFNLGGTMNSYIDDDSMYLEIGDVNNDQIVDLVLVNDKRAVLYTSYTKTNWVGYKRTDSMIALNAKGHNQEYAVTIADIDQDGVKEIAFVDYNAQGYQTYQIVSGRTLAKIMTLCPQGVGDEDCFQVLDFDVNKDGYNEILYLDGEYYLNILIDGKTGAELKVINPDDLEDEYYPNRERYWHPDYQIPFPDEGMNIAIMSYKDVNNDGYNEFAVTKQYYDRNYLTVLGSLIIYDGRNYETLEVISLTQGYGSAPKVMPLENSDRYYVLNFSDRIDLLDLEAMEMIASYGLSGNRFILLDADHMAVLGSGIYRASIFPGFELESSVPAFTRDDHIDLKWQADDDYGVMVITDNGNTVYSGSADEYTLYLLEGDHNIGFTYQDSYGKSTTRTFSINVSGHKAGYLGVILLMIALAALGLFFNLQRKIRIRSYGRKEFRHE